MDMETLRANGAKPVRLTADGNMFIGDDEFPYPVEQGSIKVERCRSGKAPMHRLTLTLFVGDVHMERPTTITETRHCLSSHCEREMTVIVKTQEALDSAFEKAGWRGKWCLLHKGND